MANKIARGTTGDTTITIPHHWEQCGYAGGFNWPGYFDDRIGINMISGGGALFIKSLTTNTVIYGPTSGWDVFADMSVTVPLTASAGNYRVSRVIYEIGEERCGIGDDTREVWLQYSEFEVVCMTTELTVTKLSSSPVPNTNPVQYAHKYLLQVTAKGGIEPYTYSWSSSVGTLSASGSSGTLTVTNSESNSGGITGTVSCTVTDSGDSECEDTHTASLADLGDIPSDGTGPEFDPGYGPGNGPTGGPCKVCPPLAVDNSAPQCGCKDAKGQPTCQGPNCPSPNGEHTEASPGTNIQRFSNYAGAGSTPTSYMVAR